MRMSRQKRKIKNKIIRMIMSEKQEKPRKEAPIQKGSFNGSKGNVKKF